MIFFRQILIYGTCVFFAINFVSNSSARFTICMMFVFIIFIFGKFINRFCSFTFWTAFSDSIGVYFIG